MRESGMPFTGHGLKGLFICCDSRFLGFFDSSEVNALRKLLPSLVAPLSRIDKAELWIRAERKFSFLVVVTVF